MKLSNSEIGISVENVKNYFFGFLFSIATLFMALDGLRWIFGYEGPINLFWGFIYGIGWYLASDVFGDGKYGTYMDFWGKVWPILILPLFITYFFGNLLARFPRKRMFILSSAIASLLILAPYSYSAWWLRHIPNYRGFMDMLY